ncbi:MAG: CYTH domain-containing protein [Candidatus Marinimicrobia bacterium]|nr:CYTH domain-containing protein [Candidatus Neomarinimicrobiota bacterium]
MKEIECKFLVVHDGYKAGLKPVHVLQGYMLYDTDGHARVRIEDGVRAFISIKKHISERSRWEFEYPVPVRDAREMIEKLCKGGVVEKNRYFPEYAGKRWDVDEYLGANEGLAVAEIELKDEDEHFEKPPWAGEDLTSDPRYLNLNLAVFPYNQW